MNPTEPAVLTVFGITGDLAKRKLLPALYNLANNNLLPEHFKVIGLSRRGTTVQDVIDLIKSAIESSGVTCDDSTLALLARSISIVQMEIDKTDDYSLLKSELDKVEKEAGVCLNRIYYLAIPSALFPGVIASLGTHGLNTGCEHGTVESRLLIEKPFGYNLQSAQELIKSLAIYFDEQHIYRIDHYLAKETVQNILTFRFQNPLFNGSWDRHHISSISVTAAESIGIENRAAFYEQTGALRDLIQSHLLQLMALATMEQPSSMSAEDIHTAKGILLGQVIPIPESDIPERTLRGQYSTYRNEVQNNDSVTETYAAIKLFIDNDRWADVPIYVRTGKAMAEKVTEIKVAFKDEQKPDKTDYLTIRIQPNEGIMFDLNIKKPGFVNETQRVQMDFYYGRDLDVVQQDAYQRVIVDALRGDKTLFATSDEVLASWKITEPILRAWASDQTPLHSYEVGSLGPESDNELSVTPQIK